jgi:hypothetical protein
MSRNAGKLLLAAFLLAGGATVRAADLYIICNSQISLDEADVRELFLGEKQFAGALKLVPVDNSAAQSLFLGRVLNMSAERYSVTWVKKSFRDGINPPGVVGSDAEALASVRRTPGACSYITTPPTTGVAVVGRL